MWWFPGRRCCETGRLVGSLLNVSDGGGPPKGGDYRARVHAVEPCSQPLRLTRVVSNFDSDAKFAGNAHAREADPHTVGVVKTGNLMEVSSAVPAAPQVLTQLPSFAGNVFAHEAKLHSDGVGKTEGISTDISSTDPVTMISPSAETTELDATRRDATCIRYGLLSDSVEFCNEPCKQSLRLIPLFSGSVAICIETWTQSSWLMRLSSPGGLLHSCGRCQHLMRMTSTANALQCSVLWKRCLDDQSRCGLDFVLEKSEGSWAIAQFSSRAS